MAKEYKEKRKALLKRAFLGSIKVYDAAITLPLVLKINPKKKRYQACSKRCLVWVKWDNKINGEEIHQRFGNMYRHHNATASAYWMIEGMTGTFTVIAWAYPKEL